MIVMMMARTPSLNASRRLVFILAFHVCGGSCQLPLQFRASPAPPQHHQWSDRVLLLQNERSRLLLNDNRQRFWRDPESDAAMIFARAAFVNVHWIQSGSRKRLVIAIRGLTRQPFSTEDCELPLAKIYENSSLDHFSFCTFNPRSNAGLLRECTRDDHDHNTSDYCNAA